MRTHHPLPDQKTVVLPTKRKASAHSQMHLKNEFFSGKIQLFKLTEFTQTTMCTPILAIYHLLSRKGFNMFMISSYNSLVEQDLSDKKKTNHQKGP